MTARLSITRAKIFDQPRIDDSWHLCKLHEPAPFEPSTQTVAPRNTSNAYSIAFVLSRGLPVNGHPKVEVTP